MASSALKKYSPGSKDFIPMRRTRALMNELWADLRTNLDHSPDTAKRMLNAAVAEMHKTDKKRLKSVLKTTKTAARKVKAAIPKKAKTSKKK